MCNCVTYNHKYTWWMCLCFRFMYFIYVIIIHKCSFFVLYHSIEATNVGIRDESIWPLLLVVAAGCCGVISCNRYILSCNKLIDASLLKYVQLIPTGKQQLAYYHCGFYVVVEATTITTGCQWLNHDIFEC